MTLKELSQLYHLNREIELDKKRLEDLRYNSIPSGNNQYDGAGRFDRTGRIAAEIADIEAIISAKIQQCIHERNRLERFINNIDDSLIRQIFTLRFINGLTWLQVSLCVGGGNTEDSVKKTCYRFLKKSRGFSQKTKSCPECPEDVC